MTVNRAWLYFILVGLFVAFIAVFVQSGDQRFGHETVVERQAIANPAASADSNPVATGQAAPWQIWRTHATHPLARLLLQLLLLVVAARLFGAAARVVRQPPVIGEIVAGIALGPSLFGMWLPEMSAQVFPADSLGQLQLLAQLGVILF